MAYSNTRRIPMAAAFWSNYVEENPELLLSYCQCVPDADPRHYFQLWWRTRAFRKDVKDFEVANFYRQAAKLGNISNIYDWMAHHPEREKRDFREWASLLHHWNDDAAAWKLLARWIEEPPYPARRPTEKEDALEATWFTNPENVMNAQMLAQTYASEGNSQKAGEVVLAIASQSYAPPWFVQKAAFIEASQGHYDVAVSSLLRK